MIRFGWWFKLRGREKAKWLPILLSWMTMLGRVPVLARTQLNVLLFMPH